MARDTSSTPDRREMASSCGGDSSLKSEADDGISSVSNSALDPETNRVLKKMLSCSVCQKTARGTVYYCGSCHNICSLCYTKEKDKCLVKACKAKLKPKSCTNRDATEMIRNLAMPVPCKNGMNGCPCELTEEMIEDHEDECVFRSVKNWAYSHKSPILFKDLKDEVEADNIKKGAKLDKWVLCDKEKTFRNGTVYWRAYKILLGPDDDIFGVVLGLTKTHRWGYVTVLGGQRVAKKYKAKLRIASDKMDATLVHTGPVFSVDDEVTPTCKEAFQMDLQRFADFNHGFDYFGDHNKTESGDMELPVTVKITKI